MPYPKLTMKLNLKIVSVAAVFASLVLSFSPAQARDMHGRMGLGYNGQFASSQQTNGVPAISIRYGLTSRMQAEVIGGFYSGLNGTGVTALKLMNTIHPETYMNFYWLIAGGYVGAGGKSGSEWLTGFGTEFFIPGIESVGLAFETGLSYENLTSSSFVLKTFGLSFINVGMHFYF